MVNAVIINRSATERRHLSELLETHGIAIVGGLAPRPGVLERLKRAAPDVVVMDLREGDAAAMDLLGRMRRDAPDVAVVVFSPDVGVGSEVVAAARAGKVIGCLRKPVDSREMEQVIADRLAPLVAAVGRSVARRTAHAKTASTPPRPAVRLQTPGPVALGALAIPPRALIIGCSTGGPNALSAVLPQLPADLGLPVLVVQHMPPRFTSLLAGRLDHECALRVSEATAGEVIEPNRVYLAPGGFHMRVRAGTVDARISLDADEPLNSCRPSVDATLLSAVEVWGGSICVAILTGMGMDGLVGARAVVEAGGRVIAQDEATSVVWGMPKVVIEADLASAVLPIEQVAEALVRVARSPGLRRHGVAS